MKKYRLTGVIGAALFLMAFPVSATPVPVSLFSECPQVGCTYVLLIGAQNISLLTNSNAKDIDDKEDIFIGIKNNSGHYIDLASFNGPDGPFPGLHLTGGLWDKNYAYFEMKDPFEHDDGKDDDDDDGMKVTPEPGSMVLLGTGLVALGGVLRRRSRA
jgi:hypothetical protein